MFLFSKIPTMLLLAVYSHTATIKIRYNEKGLREDSFKADRYFPKLRPENNFDDILHCLENNDSSTD